MRSLILTLLMTAVHCSSVAADSEPRSEVQKNVLFLAVDDLKPRLGCYGHPEVHSPCIDRLARSGTVFTNAHCQQALCGPSRLSLLTGCFPDTLGIYGMGSERDRFRAKHPNLTTIPQHFKNHGYTTVGIGKIFDPRNVAMDQDGRPDPPSWSRYVAGNPSRTASGAATKPYQNPATGLLASKYIREGRSLGLEGKQLRHFVRDHGGGPAVESWDADDEDYKDGLIASYAIEQIEELKRAGDPFLLAVGFYKPHLPFVAPKRYWDLYDRDAIKLPTHSEYPAGSPSLAQTPYVEARTYSGVPKVGAIDPAIQRELIHGYLACVSYIDAQIGRVIEKLKSAGLDENTVIVLWGDHGFHLGDKQIWGKHTTYEQSTRAPLIIANSGRVVGQSNKSLVNLIDIFPTLCELVDLTPPPAIEGRSLAGLLHSPEKSVNRFAASIYRREKYSGVAIRTQRHRYVAWYKGFYRSPWTGVRLQPEPEYTELYDYQDDPFETQNLSGDPAYSEIESQLAQLNRSHVSRTQKNQFRSVEESFRESDSGSRPSSARDSTEVGQVSDAHSSPNAPKRNVKSDGSQGIKDPPNFLIMMADDLGSADLGCFGSESIQTPHLDRFASQGMRCTQFYVPSPSCSPSRGGMMTGRSPHRLGIFTFIEKDSVAVLQDDEITFAKLLQSSGYDTCFVGKWGLNARNDFSNEPTPHDHGFNHWLATQNNSIPTHRDPETLVRNGEVLGAVQGFASQIIVDEAIEWLHSRSNKDKPFCLVVWTHEPHLKLAQPERFTAMYEGRGLTEQQKNYNANVSHMDFQLGRLLETIDNLGETESTFSFFTSDNGAKFGHQNVAGDSGIYRGGKGTLHEGGIRMPTIIRWPRWIEAGSSNDTPLSTLDLFPTVCKITEQPLPQDREVDGTSFLDLILGNSIERKTPLFFVSPTSIALRTGPWKLILDYENTASHATMIEYFRQRRVQPPTSRGKPRSAQLYNLDDDVSEQRNLLFQHRDLADSMYSTISKVSDAVQRDIPDQPAPNFIPKNLYLQLAEANPDMSVPLGYTHRHRNGSRADPNGARETGKQ